MRLWSDLLSRARSLASALFGRAEDAELAEEIRFHIEKEAEKNLAAGMSPSEARRQAHIKFGGVERMREKTREARGIAPVETLVRNVRVSVRALAKSPGLTVVVILTLAVGIGANSAVFSALDAVVIRPLPYPDGDELVRIEQVDPEVAQRTVAPVRIEDWHATSRTFQSITGYYVEDVTETSGELPERLRQAQVAPRFLETLRVEPVAGRDFVAEELRFGGPRVALVSDRYRVRRFGLDSDPIGEVLSLSDGPREIGGVLPSSFEFPDSDVEIWVPVPPDWPLVQTNRAISWYQALGRMNPGVATRDARADLSAVQEALGQRFPETDEELTVALSSLKDETVGSASIALWFLYGAVSLLLLIACTNIASLLLVRAERRRSEVAIRFTLGASRGSVVAQRLTEAGVLALAGGALSILLAAGAIRVFRALAGDLPRVDEVALDGRMLLYALACSIVVTVVSGTLPALTSSRRDTRRSLAEGGRSQVSSGARTHWMLVGTQVALAVTLLSGTGLLVRSFLELGRVSPGFDPSGVVALKLSTSWSEANGPPFLEWSDRTLEQLAQGPGVESAAISLGIPGLRASEPVAWEILDQPDRSESQVQAEAQVVTAGYFETVGIPLLSGEVCRANREGVPTGMVNRRFAEAYLGGMSATGLRVRQVQGAFDETAGLGREITGIVGDARENSLDSPPEPTVYACGAAAFPPYHFLVRVAGDPAEAAPTLRRWVGGIDPSRAVYEITPLEEHLSGALAEERLRTSLVSFFAATAVFLACLGLYGTLGYFVGVRRREIGLRMALGARRERIVSDLVAKGLGVAAIGASVGLLLAFLLGGVMEGMLYGVSPSDPWTLAGVVAFVLVAAGGAALLPSIRGSRVEPMQVLKEE